MAINFGQRPPRSPMRVSPLTQARWQVIQGARKQIPYIEEDATTIGRYHRSRGRGQWYEMYADGFCWCSVYISNRKVINADFWADTPADAITQYEQIIAEFEAGEWDKRIETHLAKIKPRKPRTGGAS